MTRLELLKAALALATSLAWCDPAAAQLRRDAPVVKMGAQGAEGQPNHRQEWLVPTPDQIVGSRAILFRPDGKGPFRLALIAHDSPATRQARALMPQPDYPGLAAALVARGFAVIVPQRLGHGKTGGPFLEDPENCDAAEYAMAAQATGEAIVTAMTFMRAQTFIRKDSSVIVGHGAGGWGALHLADQSPKNISAIIVFAPGRDARKEKDKREITACANDKFLDVVKESGEDAKVPVTWIVAENDLLFPPEFSKTLSDAFINAGGKVDFRVLPPFGRDGHALAETGEQAMMDQIIAGAAGLNVQPPVAQGAGAKAKKQ